MKLPKLELRFRRGNAANAKVQLLKQYQKGKSKYILNNTILYALIYTGVKILLDLITGQVFSVMPGFPTKIVFHAKSLIDITVWALMSPLAGYWFAKGQWKQIEKRYQMLSPEEQASLEDTTATSEEPNAEAIQKIPVTIRNLRPKN